MKFMATIVYSRGQDGFRGDERPHNICTEFRKKSPFTNAGVRKSSAREKKALRISRKSARLESTLR